MGGPGCGVGAPSLGGGRLPPIVTALLLRRKYLLWRYALACERLRCEPWRPWGWGSHKSGRTLLGTPPAHLSPWPTAPPAAQRSACGGCWHLCADSCIAISSMRSKWREFMVGTKISGLTGGPSYCQPGGAGHASLSSTPLVPRGASASRYKEYCSRSPYAVAQRRVQGDQR